MANFCSECGKALEPDSNFCIGCGASLTGKKPAKPLWQEKHDRVLANHRPSGKNRLKMFIVLAVVVVFGGWVYFNLPESGNPVIKASPAIVSPASYSVTGEQMIDVPAKVENRKIILPLDLLRERKFIAFQYSTELNNIPLLAYITGEGKVVTAVSMCEPCNSTRFHMKGDKLVCNSCGSTWELNDLEPVSGSCGKYPPDALPNTVAGNEIQIDEQLVVRWQRRI